MSTIHHNSLPSLPSPWILPPQTQPAHDSGRIIFTRQLWQRTMPDGNQSDQVVLNKSQAQETRGSHITPSRRASSSASSRSQRRSPSPARSGSKTPLTPEESPPFKTTRKRNAGIVEAEDKEIDSPEATSAHARENNGDSGIHVCICQPDPKIPRPRNAFILYRQHHQANVVAQNPGLANPEISKIIGEQWQNQTPEVKNRWKSLAEEEKLRHQQQYPTYRYQPKRSGRRNSLSSEGHPNGEKARCTKCGGRSILAPSTPYSNLHSNNPSPASGPQTPGSVITPVSRTLPVLKDLSLQSPAARRTGKHFPGSNMSPSHADERDDLGPLSPDLKRRRYNGDHPPTVSRPMPPRYVAAPPGPPAAGPGTPFPFAQAPPHPYPPGATHARRESLPGVRGVVSPPGAMAPPPRPGPGYQQHRLSQGHIPHDRSLTLPPLQTNTAGGVAGAVATAGTGKTVKEQIMNIDFRNKINILRRVAPPTPVKKSALRGPLVVLEGDNAEAVKDLGTWLSETLRKDDDLTVRLVDGPSLAVVDGKEALMARYHRLAAEWLARSADIKESLSIKTVSPTDSVMVDAAPTPTPKATGREIDENYDDSESSTSKEKDDATAQGEKDSKPHRTNSGAEKMDVDSAYKPASTGEAASKDASSSAKPVSIIANYSLHASNFFACNIPIDAHDPYMPTDHWQWTATQWRGIISPDLTIYVRDGVAGDSGKQSVDILDEGNLFVVKRTKVEGKETLEIEPSTLRRLGFEVSEWVRAFGSNAN